MKHLRQYSRKALAGFMSIWLSGIALLLFCQMPARAGGTDYCPLAKAAKGHCDHATKESKSDSFSQSTAQAFDCCAFIPAIFDKTRKVDRHSQPANIAEKLEPLRVEVRSVRYDWPKAIHASYRPVPDRIFIKYHALRI